MTPAKAHSPRGFLCPGEPLNLEPFASVSPPPFQPVWGLDPSAYFRFHPEIAVEVTSGSGKSPQSHHTSPLLLSYCIFDLSPPTLVSLLSFMILHHTLDGFNPQLRYFQP